MNKRFPETMHREVPSLSMCEPNAITDCPIKSGPGKYPFVVDWLFLGILEVQEVTSGTLDTRQNVGAM
jgi:hypothetical protein